MSKKTAIKSNTKTSTFWRFVEYILYAYIAIFPFLSFKTFLFGGSSTRAASLILLTIFLGIALSLYMLRNGKQLLIPKSPIFVAISAYFIFIVISGIMGLDFNISFWSVVMRMTGIWYLLSLGFFIYIFWLYVHNNPEKQDKIILTVILSTSIYSLLYFLSPEGIGLLFSGYRSEAFTFGNTTFAGMYIFGAFLLSLYYLFRSEAKKWWMYVLPLLLIINPSILNIKIWSGDFSGGFIGEARASAYVIIASIISLIVIWSISKIRNLVLKKKVSYLVFAVSVLTVIISAFSLLSHDGYLRKIYLSQATAVRPIVWDMSEKAIAQSPYFGWGTDNFERVFEKNYDNRLLQDEYGNEAWLDRAHNVFIDELIENGFVGLLFYLVAYIVIILSLMHVALNSKDNKDRILASILIVYFPLHFVELQTAFDTTISYVMLAFMIMLAIVLFGRARKTDQGTEAVWTFSNWVKYLCAVIALLYFSWSFLFGWIPFISAQIANGHIRTAGSSEKRIPLYQALFSSPTDKHSFLWRTSTDFQKGIGENPAVLSDPKKVASLKKEIEIFEEEYRQYIKGKTDHFRAKLNLADMLIYQRLFGVNKLVEAQEVLDEAIKIVPQAPQPYWMKAVAYVYMKQFDLAKDYANKGLALNPKIKQSQEVVRYVEESIRDFPDINLYFFKQI